MTLKRLALLFCVFLFAFSANPLHAQMTGDIAEGATPYESFHGGDIDSVNLSNGNLVLSIPLVSYPQRGALKFGFSFIFNGKSTHTVESCTPVPPVNCTYYWTFASPTVVEDNSLSIVEKLFQPSGANTNKMSEFAVVTSDGGQHPLVGLTTGQITGDATGFWANSSFDTGIPAPTVIISRNGVRNFITGSVLREDANGNQILIGASDYTDTMGRQVSAIGSSVPGTSSSTAACPSGPLPVASATTWTVPGEGGGTMQFMFCQVEAPINIPAQGKAPAVTGGTDLVTQSIVLPNSTVWTFAYDSYGLINQVTLPTGGTIAYTYTSGPLGGCNYQNNISRSVATRTVNANDGTGAHTWQYTGTVPTVKVTDPLANDTVHTFSLFGTAGGCFNFETLTQYYQGSSTGGTLLKTAKTDWNNFANGNDVYTSPGMVPVRVTTTWPSGQVTKVETDYDAKYTFESVPIPYGNVVARREYDYGSGTPGGLLRTTTTQYQAFISPTYLTNNLLSLPSSVQITDGGGTQRAYTTYSYDEYGLGSSGIGSAQQHDTAPADGAQRGNQTSVHRWLNTTGTYLVSTAHYFDTGKMQTSTDPIGNSTSFAYSATYEGAYPTTVTNALSQITTHVYDFNSGRITSTTDPNSQIASATYDEMWRPLSISYPDGGKTTNTYNDASTNPTVTATKLATPNPSVTSVQTFDGLGRIQQAQLSDAQGTIYTATTYDADGRKASVSNPYRTKSDPTYGVTSYVYDGIGRTCVVVPPDGTAVAGSTCPASQPSNDIFTAYAGNQTTVTDQQGITRKSQTDGLGRLTNVWEAPSSVNFQTTYAYDALDDLVSVVQGTTHNRSFIYDSLKRLTSSTNPETGTTSVTYAYDANGNLVTKTDARGTIINYSPTSNPIDPLNRVRSKTYSDGTPTVVYAYDGNTPSACSSAGFSYANSIGRRTGMCDADGSEFWSYDPMGREKAEQRTTNSITKTTGYTYDLNGDLATLTYPSGRIITYVTDSAGRPSSAEDVPNNIFYTQGTCTNGISSLGACYAPQGAIASANIGPTGGSTWLKAAVSYNDRLQPNQIQYSNQAGNLMSLQYSFLDASSHNNGNVMGITNVVDGTRSQQFTYDQLNRLLTAETTSTYSTSPTHCWGEAYVYDNSTTTPGEFGNLTNINVPSTAYNGCQIESSFSLVANGNNQLTAFSYDASGNTLNDTHNSYTWNAESEIQTAGGVTYTYDGDGDRVQKSSGKIYWYGAGSEILDESDSSGNITDEYVYFGGKRVAHRVVSGNSIYYYGEDFLGTSRQIFTSASALCYDADFYPFGGERAYTTSCTPTYKFEGKERDTETNNDDFGARYYSSSFGRWTSPDWSAIPAPVPYADLTNPQTLNLYAMVKDNPETFADLDGHIDCSGQKAKGIGCQYIAKWNAQFGIGPTPKVNNAPGVPVTLPNGSHVPDRKSATGLLMSPTADLSDVAAAGRDAGATYRALLAAGDDNALMYLFAALGAAVGTGGAFDYQRMGPQSATLADILSHGDDDSLAADLLGTFQLLPQFRDVSNFNVGLFSQQAGLTLDETLSTAGRYAAIESSNARPGNPNGLDTQTAQFIKAGYKAGEAAF